MKKAEGKQRADLDAKARLNEGGRGGLAWVDEDLDQSLGAADASVMGGQIRRAMTR